MKAAASATSAVQAATKAATGIAGFDAITGGGLPRGRTTLLVGGPGSGKTVFAMQCLVHGARACKEPGIFVAFEETAQRIRANFGGFGWGLPALQTKRLAIVDAQPAPDLIQCGTFDLGGMLAALELQARQIGARRIVFDALDIVLALLPDAAAFMGASGRLRSARSGRGIRSHVGGLASCGRDEARVGARPCLCACAQNCTVGP